MRAPRGGDIAAWLFAAAAVFGGLAWWLPRAEWSGDWLDKAFSEAVSERIGASVRFYDVKVKGLDEIRFALATVTGTSHETLVASGPGVVTLQGIGLLKGEYGRIRISLKDVAVLEHLYRRSSAVAWASREAFRDPIYAERVDIVILDAEMFYEAHILDFRSTEMRVKGGVRWAGRRVLKANLMVLLPEEKFEKVPKELRARMIRRRDGWKGVRIVYGSGHLSVIGARGPFFRASWQETT